MYGLISIHVLTVGRPNFKYFTHVRSVHTLMFSYKLSTSCMSRGDWSARISPAL